MKRIVRLKIPRLRDLEDACARTTDFSHVHRREFERLREEAEARGAGLWGACPNVQGY